MHGSVAITMIYYFSGLYPTDKARRIHFRILRALIFPDVSDIVIGYQEHMERFVSVSFSDYNVYSGNKQHNTRGNPCTGVGSAYRSICKV